MDNKLLKTHTEVKHWLNEMKIKNYTIHDNLQVSVEDDVNLKNRNLSYLPVQFRNVLGSFLCGSNNLKTLQGSPQYVKKDFNGNSNQLISLIGAPNEVGEGFFCSDNKLTSLMYAPTKVGTIFNCSGNRLSTLEYGPIEVGSSYFCNDNFLTSLKGAPIQIDRTFNCKNNKLTSLMYAPTKVGAIFNCSANQLTTLDGVPEVGKVLYCGDNKLTSLKGLTKTQMLSCPLNPITDFFENEIMVKDLVELTLCEGVEDLASLLIPYLLEPDDDEIKKLYSLPFEEFKHILNMKRLNESLQQDLANKPSIKRQKV